MASNTKFKSTIIDKLKQGLVVSCQASVGEPLYGPEYICAMALSAINGGACGLRIEGKENIKYMRQYTKLPIIGLIKSQSVSDAKKLSSVYITSTWKEAYDCAKAGADIIAIDATGRPRLDFNLAEFIERIHVRLNKPVWADISTYEEGIVAAKLGADVVSTTMYGYTDKTYKPDTEPPDFKLLESLCKELSTPVVLEGRVWYPQQVTKAFELGAYAVVVGSAITRPQLITKRFVEAIDI